MDFDTIFVPIISDRVTLRYKTTYIDKHNNVLIVLYIKDGTRTVICTTVETERPRYTNWNVRNLLVHRSPISLTVKLGLGRSVPYFGLNPLLIRTPNLDTSKRRRIPKQSLEMFSIVGPTHLPHVWWNYWKQGSVFRPWFNSLWSTRATFLLTCYISYPYNENYFSSI